MGSVDRQKKRDMLWKKAILHFSLCFAMGFFTGFAPSGTSTDSVFTSTTAKVAAPFSDVVGDRIFNRSLMSQTASEQLPLNASTDAKEDDDAEHRAEQQQPEEEDGTESMDAGFADVEHPQQYPTTTATPRRLVILVTTARPGGHDPFRAASLGRLANTLRLVPPPLLWVVVEPQAGSADTAAMLRMTGIMYRHLVYRDNFTGAASPTAEVDHQRNLALNHLEHHRLDGVVHFADMTNVYDLGFFDHIRAIEAFGTWPVAFVSPNRKRVVVEGPVCRESLVIGWHINSINTTTAGAYDGGNISITATARIPRLNVSSFAFNSSILWDPERWGRSSSISDTSQDSFKFIQETVVEDNSKLLPIPADCKRVMIWRLHAPKVLYPGYQELSEREPNQR